MIDWARVLRLTLISRFLDDTEEQTLVPEKKVLYQFSARGHDVAQLILAQHLTHKHDAAGAYYRSRPLLLSLGLSVADAFAGPRRAAGGMSGGRDIGVVCNLPNDPGPVVLPMSGDVGSQYTPAAGWAQAILYHRTVLEDAEYRARSPASWAARPRSPPTGSGPRSPWRPRFSCPWSSTSRTTATASRCPRGFRRRAETSRPISPRSEICWSGTATA